MVTAAGSGVGTTETGNTRHDVSGASRQAEEERWITPVADNMKEERRATDINLLKYVQSFPKSIVDSIELNVIEHCKRAVSVTSGRMFLH